MKIGYFADGLWAHKALEKIIQDDTLIVSFICVRNDSRDSVLIQMGKDNDIDVLWHENINSDDFISKMEAYNVDLFVSMSFNQIFKKKMINLPPLKTINCHAGKLPFYRGRNILNWALINDEKEFGITVHYVDEGIDTGDIILQNTYPITDEDDYSTLLNKSHSECATILYDAIKMIQNGTAKRISQTDIDPVGFYCGMRTVGDELLDWNQTSRQIFNFVRAICKPGPQALTYIDEQPVYINKVRMINGVRNYIGTPGQILGKTEDGYIVKTLDTMIEIIEYSSEAILRVGKRFYKRVK